MENFTPFSALAGGALIGLAAAMMLLFNGRIAGISGILGGVFTPRHGDVGWRVAFLGGLLSGGLLLALAWPSALAGTLDRSVAALAVAGLLVGFGTRMGSGCTSGHGVCGLSRFSPRSAVATVTFMAAGVAAAAVITQLFGGVL